MSSSHETLTVEIPTALLTTPMDREIAVEALLLRVAAAAYEEGRLTAGQASELCGLRRIEFLGALADLGVSAINLTTTDLRDDLDYASTALAMEA